MVAQKALIVARKTRLPSLLSPWPSVEFPSIRHSSSSSKQQEPALENAKTKNKHTSNKSLAKPKEKKKTMAELDEELRLKLEGISGDGGAAGLELEDGKPVAMKRGVKENMFRLI
ncbi:hypothetical protein MMC12_001708 [Toensbergia leucococca]|nr:hypothetical protein [Toensbergia leucococca]